LVLLPWGKLEYRVNDVSPPLGEELEERVDKKRFSSLGGGVGGEGLMSWLREFSTLRLMFIEL